MSNTIESVNPFINSLQWNPSDSETAVDSLSSELGNQSLGQSEFLELMTAQLMNQDPFAPMDNADFIGQMAQFGTVSGIGDLRDEFANLSSAMTSQMLVDASNIVGKSVLTESSSFMLQTEGELSGVLKFDTNVDSVTINIEDESGGLVRTIQYGAQAAGDMPFSWDGMNDEGDRMPKGLYKLSANASVQGEALGFSPYVYAEVDSVSVGQNQSSMVLHVEGVGEKTLDEVHEIARAAM